MALSGSYGSSGNLGIYVNWSATQSVTGNYSDLTQNVYLRRVDFTYNISSSGVSTINGSTKSFSTSGVTPSTTDMFLCSHTQRIMHNSSGEANNISLSAVWDCPGAEYHGSHIASLSASTSVNLDVIDRSSPSVSASASNIRGISFTLTVTASAVCNLWRYSLNNGSSWTTFSTEEGASQSCDITGLTPNTSYTVKVQVQKKSNQTTGTSSLTVKTAANSFLNSVETVTIDEVSPTVTFSISLSGNYKHSLTIKKGSTTLLTFSNLTLTDGSNTINLTSDQRTTLLNATPNSKSFSGTFELRTYNGSSQVGSVSSRTATLRTTSANSAPTFLSFTYRDSNSEIVAITENDQIIVQSLSTVALTASPATAKNGATISSYSVKMGDKTATSSNTSITLGSVDNIGEEDTANIVVTAVDSRGWTTSVTVSAPIMHYSKIDILNYTVVRLNGVDDTISVDLDGAICPLIVNDVNKNGVTYCAYRYKRTDSSTWSEWNVVTGSVISTNETFEYTNEGLVELDSGYSFDIEFTVEDHFTSDSISDSVAQGIPLISFRKQKIGINMNEPDSALDVNGIIRQNGQNVLGYVGLVETDFNNYITTGFYFYDETRGAQHAPSNNGKGVLFVVCYDSENVFQMYYSSNSTRTRALSGTTWSSWRTLL